MDSLVAFLSRGSFVDEASGESSTGYTPLSDSEMAKLWKGLFYCTFGFWAVITSALAETAGFWMSDKPLVQQRLASDLAELLLLINPSSSTEAQREQDQLVAALGFLKGFWQAIVREWTGVDRLRSVGQQSATFELTDRMDKFYMLMRRYVNATFRLLARHGWSEQAVDGVNEILTSKTGPMT